MTSFKQYLQEIAYTGNILDNPKISPRSSKKILPDPNAGKIVPFYSPYLHDILTLTTKTSLKKEFEPIPKEIIELTTDSKEPTNLSASDIYLLQDFMNRIINKSPKFINIKYAQKVLDDLQSSIDYY